MAQSSAALLDHLLAITFALGFPLINAPIYARRRPLLRAGDSATRQREYRETVLWLGAMGVATLAVWFVYGREPAALGLAPSVSPRSLLSLAFAIAVGGALFWQARSARRDPRTREAARKALEPVREYLPASVDELRLFRAVSVSAGIGEELFYRGFLLWYLGLSMPLLWAVVVSSILFGFAHIMHGGAAALRATVLGAFLAGLYVFSGALWAPMLLHTAIDLSSGQLSMAVYESEPQAAT